MTQLGINIAEFEKPEKDVIRFGQYLAWITAAALFFGTVEVVGDFVFRNRPIGNAGIVVLGFAACMLFARWHLKRGRFTTAVWISSLSLLTTILLEALILPGLTLPAVIILPIVVVASALPYLNDQNIKILIFFSWAIGVFIMTVGEQAAPSPIFPTWFAEIFRISTVATVLGLAFLLMWQFASNRNDMLVQLSSMNADLATQASRLESANKELEGFAYSVSHDLRAPLRAIDGYTRFLVEDYESILDAEGHRICSIISDETHRMGQLIDDLLSFSRMGRKEMSAVPIDMENLATLVANELVTNQNRERIDLKIDHLPPTVGDSALLHQVWVNLLSNAIKFSSGKARSVIEVGFLQKEVETIYFVRDNGAGFNMRYIDKLFGVFQRLHTEREFEGTGVGLAIAQRVIHRHGGRIWAEGEQNKGAIFYFALPKKDKEHGSAEHN